jgi:hypothetical protein
VTPDPICPARHGRHRCERWDLPAAHLDGQHRSGRVTWPVEHGAGQMELDLNAATSAAPARTEAA